MAISAYQCCKINLGALEFMACQTIKIFFYQNELLSIGSLQLLRSRIEVERSVQNEAVHLMRRN
jgi:hypothetical protein